MEDKIRRTQGKLNGDLKKSYLREFYLKHCPKPLPSTTYNAVLNDMLQAYGEAIVTEGLELKLGKVGRLRIRTKFLHLLRKDGNLSRSIKVNWEKTKAHWAIKYPGLTFAELKAIKNKPLIYHDNDHTEGEFYEHYWDRTTAITKNLGCYKFKPSRKFSRLIAKIVKDPHRKIFYYE